MDTLDMEAPRPRLCHIIKRPDFEGYGFNLHAEKAKPGQFIGKVDANSPAEAGGLKEGDHIIEVNGVNIVQENHKQVVQRIKAVPNETKLLVVDKETEDYYKRAGILVKSSLDTVDHRSSELPGSLHKAEVIASNGHVEYDKSVSRTSSASIAKEFSSSSAKIIEEDEEEDSGEKAVECATPDSDPPAYEESFDDDQAVIVNKEHELKVSVEVEPEKVHIEREEKPELAEPEKVHNNGDHEEEEKKPTFNNDLLLPAVDENHNNEEEKPADNDEDDDDRGVVMPPVEKQTSLSSSNSASGSSSGSSPRTTPSPVPLCRSDSDQRDWDGLRLNLTAREMRERIGSKKKSDPRREKLDMRKKYEIIQTL